MARGGGAQLVARSGDTWRRHSDTWRRHTATRGGDTQQHVAATHSDTWRRHTATRGGARYSKSIAYSGTICTREGDGTTDLITCGQHAPVQLPCRGTYDVKNQPSGDDSSDEARKDAVATK